MNFSEALTPVSQLAMRWVSRYPVGELAILHPPDRALIAQLESNPDLRLKAVCGWNHSLLDPLPGSLRAQDPLVLSPQADDVLCFMPKARARLDLSLSLLTEQTLQSARLWLIGEKRSGVESAAKRLRVSGWTADKLDSARRSQIWRLEAPQDRLVSSAEALLTPASPWLERFEEPDSGLRLATLPGVFSHGSLDPGSAFLLKVLREQGASLVHGRILDFGCGSGVLALWAARQASDARIEAIDSDYLAVLCTRYNRDQNGISAERVEARWASSLDHDGKAYDLILSNPPFHQDRRVVLEPTLDFLASCRRRLSSQGRLWVVANAFLPYADALSQHFPQWRIIDQNRQYKIYEARL